MSGLLLLQISDTHFGTERPAVAEALVRLVQAQRPDILVLSGDITQRARAVQFRAARAFVDRLGIAQRVVIPGNHDIPLYNLAARVLAPYAGFRKCFGRALEHEIDTPELLLLALNTTRWYRHVDGELSDAQIDRVAGRLARAAAGQVRIVVTHQPVAVTRPQDEHNRLHGHAAAITRWSEAGADLVLGGHIHLPFLLPLHEQQPGLAGPMWAVQAGTAVSSRVRHEADNSVNLIRLGGGVPGSSALTPEPEGLRPSSAPTATRHSHVARWDYRATADAFVQVAEQALQHGAPLPAADTAGLR